MTYHRIFGEPSASTLGTGRPVTRSCVVSGIRSRATIRCVTISCEPTGQKEITWLTLRSDSSVIARSTTASPASNFGDIDPDVTTRSRWSWSWNQSGTASDTAYASPHTTTTDHRTTDSAL